MTYAYIQSLFYTLLGDSESSPMFITNGTAEAYAVWAVQKMVDQTHSLEKRAIQPVTANVAEYALPGDTAQVQRVSFDQEKILPVTREKLRRHNPRWRDHTGTPRLYYLDEINHRIGLYETPSVGSVWAATTGTTYGGIRDMAGASGTAYGGIRDPGYVPDGGTYGGFREVYDESEQNNIELIYWADAPSSFADGIPLPAWAHPGVLYYMLSEAYSTDTEIRNDELAAFWYTLFDRVLQRLGGRAASKLPRTWTKKMYAGGIESPVLRIMPEHIPEPT